MSLLLPLFIYTLYFSLQEYIPRHLVEGEFVNIGVHYTICIHGIKCIYRKY
jgi:hypothetical protein